MKKKTALIIIDVQVGIIMDPQYPIFEADKLLIKLRSLIDKAHSSGTPVIYVQHTEGDEQVLGQGRPGWAIHPAIFPIDKDITIIKFTPDAFFNTDLHAILSKLEIEQLIVAGLQTEYCIDTTCRRAFSLGYKTILIEDAHSTMDSDALSAQQIIDHHNQVLGGWFVSLVESDAILF